MKARQTRHSKVYTSRGARDRRVRLSALTAIQFYDVQDRLGYERSSEAVDWLLLKAKASIEALPKKPNAISPYSADQEKLRSLQHFGVDPVNISGSCPVMENFVPGFNYELGRDIADPFLAIGSQENLMLQEQTLISLPEFLPSSCLDQVVYSASLFSEQTTPIQRSVFSSALASSMDAPLSFASKTPGTGLTLPIQFQIGE